jgi:hypothetical protein
MLIDESNDVSQSVQRCWLSFISHNGVKLIFSLDIIFSAICILFKLSYLLVGCQYYFIEFLFIPGHGFLISQFHCCLD